MRCGSSALIAKTSAIAGSIMVSPIRSVVAKKKNRPLRFHLGINVQSIKALGSGSGVGRTPFGSTIT